MPNLSLFDMIYKVAIVSGGGNGISKAIALGFARAGAHVCPIYKVPGRADQTAAAIKEIGCSSLPETGHAGHESVSKEFVAQVVDRFGRIDVLVNGAGGMRTADGLYYQRSFEELTEEELDEVFRNNVKSAFFMCRAVGPAMLERGNGSIINVS